MPPDPGKPARSGALWRLILLATFTLALGLRLAYLRQFAGLPFFDQPVGDSAIYLARAREIASGVWLPTQPFFYGSILYPYFLAFVLGPLRGTIFGVALLQVLVGSALVVLLASLAKRAFGMVPGVVCGALAALYGPLAFMESDVLGVIWGLLALASGIYFCRSWLSAERCDGKQSTLWLLAGGGRSALQRRSDRTCFFSSRLRPCGALGWRIRGRYERASRYWQVLPSL
jgi:hypothetical protein